MGTKYKKNEKTGLYTALIWDGTYDADGRKHRKKLTSRKSSADLEKQVAQFKKEVEEKGSVTKLSQTPFLIYAREWLDLTKTSKELNTRKMYRYTIDRYFGIIADVPISEIRHSHFQAVINSQLNHPRTCQQIALTFRQIIKYAAKNHHIPAGMVPDIIDDISIPKCRKPQKRALNAIEKEAIEKADLDPRKRAFLSILYYCGLRRGEALALRSDDFDWDAPSVSISKVIVFDVNSPILKPYPKSERGIRRLHVDHLSFGVPELHRRSRGHQIALRSGFALDPDDTGLSGRLHRLRSLRYPIGLWHLLRLLLRVIVPVWIIRIVIRISHVVTSSHSNRLGPHHRSPRYHNSRPFPLPGHEFRWPAHRPRSDDPCRNP